MVMLYSFPVKNCTVPVLIEGEDDTLQFVPIKQLNFVAIVYCSSAGEHTFKFLQ